MTCSETGKSLSRRERTLCTWYSRESTSSSVTSYASKAAMTSHSSNKAFLCFSPRRPWMQYFKIPELSTFPFYWLDVPKWLTFKKLSSLPVNSCRYNNRQCSILCHRHFLLREWKWCRWERFALVSRYNPCSPKVFLTFLFLSHFQRILNSRE